MKIKETLKKGSNILIESNIEDAYLKARILLSNILGTNKEYLIIHSEEEIDEKIDNQYMNEIEKLKNHEPIQYIVKKQEFMGLNFYVDNNVLIPQPDTENLVEEVLIIVHRKWSNSYIIIKNLKFRESTSIWNRYK